MSPSTSIHGRGGPYPSAVAGLGGIPNIPTDIPICVVFIMLYLAFAIRNGIIFRSNHRQKHKFIPTILLYGFCLSRVVTLVLRIAWATRPHNPRLAIAAGIFTNIGILLVYIVNLVLAQRILRAKQPYIGWHPFIRLAYKLLFAALGVALIMVVCTIIIVSYTLDMRTRLVCRDIQLAAITFVLFFTTLPAIQIVTAFLLPRSEAEDDFGVGSMKSKVIVLGTSTALSILDAGFKAGTAWMPPRRATDPAWYQSKACFYVFYFGLEILILGVLTFGSIDRRFWVPNGCTKAGDYTRLLDEKERQGNASESQLATSK